MDQIPQKNPDYIHGYSPEEQERLKSQATLFERIVFQDVDYIPGGKILEVGCGVGAQTEILLRRFPDITLVGIDRESAQLARARSAIDDLPYPHRAVFHQQDAKKMTFGDNSFDGAFLCWVLEHIPNCIEVLREVKRVLKPGAPVWISEVHNQTLFVDPYSPALLKYWFEFNDHQWRLGGDPFVGAKLGNLLAEAGFSNIRLCSKPIHYDNRDPIRRSTIIDYFNDLLLSGAPSLIGAQKVTKDLVKSVQTELDSLKKSPYSVFYYSFIQATATA